MAAPSWNKVISSSSLSRWWPAPTPTASRWRWGFLGEPLVQESVSGSPASSPGGGSFGLLLQGRRAGCGSRGGSAGGPSSSFPWRWRSSTASCGPGAEELGAHPRSMGFRRRLHLIHVDECLVRLFSKPCGVRVPHDPNKTELRRWGSVAASSGGRRIQLEDWRCRRS